MKNRLKILKQIDNLTDKHCTPCTASGKTKYVYCNEKCDIGKKLQQCGDALLKPRKNKVDELLAKGRDLTYTEIKRLLEVEEVTKIEVAKAMNMGGGQLLDYLKTNEEREKAMAKQKEMKQEKPKQKAENKVSNYDKTKELFAKGLEAEQIATRTGLTVGSVRNYITKIKNEEQKEKEIYEQALKEVGGKMQQTEKNEPQDKTDWETEYKELLNEHDTVVATKNLKINSLQSDNEHLKEELEALKEINGEISDENQRLEERNRKLTDGNITIYKRNRELEEKLKNEEQKNKSLFKYIALEKEVM